MENILAAILKLPREEKLQIFVALEKDLDGFEDKNAENHLSDEEWGLMDDNMAEGNDEIKSANHEEVMRWLQQKD